MQGFGECRDNPQECYLREKNENTFFESGGQGGYRPFVPDPIGA